MRTTLGAPVFVALACSGGWGLISHHTHLAYLLAGVVALAAYVSIRVWMETRNEPYLPVVIAAALVLNPAWTVSALHGDCGFAKAATAEATTALVGFLLAAQLLATGARKLVRARGT